MSDEINNLLQRAKKETTALAFEVTKHLEKTVGQLETQIEELNSENFYLELDPAELFPPSPGDLKRWIATSGAGNAPKTPHGGVARQI